jgi:multiple sugar transport system permease protein
MTKAVRNIAGKSFAYFVLISFSFVCLLPFFWMVTTSLKETGAIFVYPPRFIPEKFAWHNYYETWTIVPFHIFLKNTVIIVVLCTIGTVLSSSLTAFGFAR